AGTREGGGHPRTRVGDGLCPVRGKHQRPRWTRDGAGRPGRVGGHAEAAAQRVLQGDGGGCARGARGGAGSRARGLAAPEHRRRAGRLGRADAGAAGDRFRAACAAPIARDGGGHRTARRARRAAADRRGVAGLAAGPGVNTQMPTDLYISTDVEADGPIPGPYSMSSIGMVAAATFDGTTFTRLDLSERFYRELKPISERFDEAAAAVS